MKLEDTAARLEALGNPTRQRIYRALVRAGDSGLTVGTLQANLDVAPSTLSHHLKTLLVVGLVTQERQATALICRANYAAMQALIAFLIEECCVDDKSSSGHARRTCK
jgi:ArsR family transcriptional regulator